MPLSKSLLSIAVNARYFGILTVLVAIGWAGHRTHWSIPHAHSESHTQKPTQSVTQSEGVTPEQPSMPWAIKFPSQHSMDLSGIVTASVDQKPICERIHTPGVITYNERMTASLSSRVTGTVWQVCRRVGETVRRGDVLVLVDATEVGQCKAEYLSALVAAEAKAETLSKLSDVAGGAVPMRLLREAKVAQREADIRLQNAEQRLLNLGLSIRTDEFRKLNDAERVEQIRLLGLPKSVIDDFDRGTATSNLLPLFATFDGIVLRQDIVVGETAEAGKPILEVGDTRRMWLKLDVPKEDAARLALRQPVTFRPDGIDQEFHALIAWISTEMNEQTRTLQVRAEVDNPVVSSDPQSGQEVRLLRANTFGTGTITLRQSDSALVVPLSAVLHDQDQPLVFVRTGDLSFERIDVTLGIRDRDQVQILADSLPSEAEIVAKGGHILKSEWMLNHVAASTP